MGRLKLKALFAALSVFGFLDIMISKSYASDGAQRTYVETVYQPIPDEFIKIQERVLEWKRDSLAEISKMRLTQNPKVVAWRKAILAIEPKNDLDLIQQINKITNRSVTYVDDYDHYKKDYWAPPYRTLTEGGDCEDIALLKLAALYMHGWPVQQKTHILVGYVPWEGREIAHAVLQVDLGGKRYVMRNFTDGVIKFNELDGLMTPIYMVNTDRLIVFNQDRHFAYLLSDEKIAPASRKNSRSPRYNE